MSNKKTFEFRMSKKVAELTQVVHMLFTRNHEKEVELEALKDAYEHEIELILKDARAKIEEGQLRIRDIQLEKNAGDNQLKSDIQKAQEERDAAWQEKVNNLEKLIRDEKRESQNSRDLLIQAQQDIERLRNGKNDDVAKLSRDFEEKSKEIERLKSTIKALEHNLNDKQHKLTSLNNLDKTNDSLRKDIDQLKEHLKGSEKLKEQVLSRNKSLESEIKHLKRELNKKSSDKPPSTAPSASSSTATEYTDELERLRREIQRYRNELSNRETNFNRMFADKNPINLNAERDRRGTPKVKTTSPAFENGVVMRIARERSSLDGALQREATVPSMDYIRERTLTSGFTANKSINDFSREEFLDSFDIKGKQSGKSGMASSMVLDTSQPHNRLPSLPNSSDPTARLQKLMKPKPLPKEMLSAKH